MKSGLVTDGCYAAALQDCDGKPTTREHPISEALLQRLGSRIVVGGLPWMKDQEHTLSPKSLAARVLCARHNNALSRYDASVCKLYDILDVLNRGEPIGWVCVSGDDLERWALKMLFAFVASGNTMKNGAPALREAPPEIYLGPVFNDEPLPHRCGFYYSENSLNAPDEQLHVFLNEFRDPDPHPGTLFGVTVALRGFTWMTSLYAVEEDGWTNTRLRFRPTGFDLGERGALRLEWRHPRESSTHGVPVDVLAARRRTTIL